METGELSGHMFWSWQDMRQYSRIDGEMRDESWNLESLQKPASRAMSLQWSWPDCSSCDAMWLIYPT